jgi:hypothetical protein
LWDAGWGSAVGCFLASGRGRSFTNLLLVYGSFRFAKRLNIQQILFATACQLVTDQVFSGDHAGGFLSINKTFDAIRPSFIERNAIDALENVNPIGRLANLKCGTVKKNQQGSDLASEHRTQPGREMPPLRSPRQNG